MIIKAILALTQGRANNNDYLSESGGDSVKAILCNDCGEVMTRFVNKCHACSRTNLTYYASPDSPELKAKVEALKGGVDGLTRVMYASLFIGIFAVVIYGYTQSMSIKQASIQPPVQTATTNSTVPQ